MTNPPDEATLPGDDPIVAEVRAQREAIAAAVDYDLDALFARLTSLQDSERSRGRVILSAPASRQGSAA